ncbi:hypothetical protein AOLI_G00100840 [Acnodon oligacanthus]
MIAARSSSVGRGGPEETSRHRRQSAASLASRSQRNSAQENSREGRTHSHSQQVALARARRALLIREIETNWYLKLCGRGKEESVAFQTGMPYRPKSLSTIHFVLVLFMSCGSSRAPLSFFHSGKPRDG